jgi:hypothetical protein
MENAAGPARSLARWGLSLCVASEGGGYLQLAWKFRAARRNDATLFCELRQQLVGSINKSCYNTG